MKQSDHIIDLTHSDGMIDAIFDMFDDLFLDNKFEVANELMKCFGIVIMPTEITLAILSITLPAAHKLPYRKVFYETAEGIIGRRHRNAKELLKGLK